MKPRKQRRLMLTGHRWKIMREVRGHAVPDRAMKRYFHIREHLGPFSYYDAPKHGKHPAKKPKATK